jgi:hypothetical protein
MDVHPPHGSIHTWWDFFVHLTIITLGLLIALGLEGIVEWAHNRHLLHRAEANLSSELHENRAILADDERSLDAAEKQLEANLNLLSSFTTKHQADGELKFNWEWNSLGSAAWDTARDTGAVALMNYAVAQRYSEIYTQQSVVNTQALAFIRDVYRNAAPLQGNRQLSTLQTAEIDSMVANFRQTMVDLKLLRNLSNSLSHSFERNAPEAR